MGRSIHGLFAFIFCPLPGIYNQRMEIISQIDPTTFQP